MTRARAVEDRPEHARRTAWARRRRRRGTRQPAEGLVDPGGGGHLAQEAARQSSPALEPYRQWRDEIRSRDVEVQNTHAAEIAAIAARLAGPAVTNADVRAALEILAPLSLDTAAAIVHALDRARITLVDQLAPTHRRHFRPQVLAVYAGLEPAELASYDERLFNGLSLAGLDSSERWLAVVVLLELSEETLLALLADKHHGRDVRVLMTTAGPKPSEPEASALTLDVHPILTMAERGITRANARAIYEELLALGDEDVRRGLVRELDARGSLDALFERLPGDVLFSESSQASLATLLAARERAHLSRHSRELMSRRDLNISSREAFLALLMMRELPVHDRRELELVDPAFVQLSASMRSAPGLHMMDAAAAARERASVLGRLVDERLWTGERAAELDTLIRMATILGARDAVFAASEARRADLVPGLDELVARHGLYDPAAGRTAFEPARVQPARGGRGLGVVRLAGTGAAIVGVGVGVLFKKRIDARAGKIGTDELRMAKAQRMLGKVPVGLEFVDAPRRDVTNDATLGWDDETDTITVDVPMLELESAVRAGPGWTVRAGAVSATGVHFEARFATEDFSQPTHTALRIATLEVDAPILEAGGRLIGAAHVRLSGLAVEADVGLEPDLPRGRRGLLRVPWAGPGLEYMRLLLAAPGLIIESGDVGRELLGAAAQLRGAAVKVDQATVTGISYGGIEQASEITVEKAQLSWGGTRAQYLRRLQPVLEARLGTAGREVARTEGDPAAQAEAVGEVARLLREIRLVGEELEVLEARESRLMELVRRQQRDPEALTEAEEQEILELQSPAPGGVVLDVGTVSVRGASGAVALPPVTFEGLLAHGVSPAVTLPLLTDPALVQRFREQGPPGRPEAAASDIAAEAARVTIGLEGLPLTTGRVALTGGAFRVEGDRVHFEAGTVSAAEAKLGDVASLERETGHGIHGTLELVERGLRVSGLYAESLTLSGIDVKAADGTTVTGTGPVTLHGVTVSATLVFDEERLQEIADGTLDVVAVEAGELRYRKGAHDIRIVEPVTVHDVHMRDLRWSPGDLLPTGTGTVGAIAGEIDGLLFGLVAGGKLDAGDIWLELREGNEVVFVVGRAGAEGGRVGTAKAGEAEAQAISGTMRLIERGIELSEVIVGEVTLKRVDWSAADGTRITGPGPVTLRTVEVTATAVLDDEGVLAVVAPTLRIDAVEAEGLRYRRGTTRDLRLVERPLRVQDIEMRDVRWRAGQGLPTAEGTTGRVSGAVAGRIFGAEGAARMTAETVDFAIREGGEVRVRARGADFGLKGAWGKLFAELEASGADTGEIVIGRDKITIGAGAAADLLVDRVRVPELRFESGGVSLTVGGETAMRGVQAEVTIHLRDDMPERVIVPLLALDDLGVDTMVVDSWAWSLSVGEHGGLGIVGAGASDVVLVPDGDTWRLSSHGEVRVDYAAAAEAGVWLDIRQLLGELPRMRELPEWIDFYEPVINNLNGVVSADVELPIYLSEYPFVFIRVDNVDQDYFPMRVSIDHGQVDLLEVDHALTSKVLDPALYFEIEGSRLVLVLDPRALAYAVAGPNPSILMLPPPQPVVRWDLATGDAERLADPLQYEVAPASVPLVSLTRPEIIPSFVFVSTNYAEVHNIDGTFSLVNEQPLPVDLGALGWIRLAPFGLTDLTVQGDLFTGSRTQRHEGRLALSLGSLELDWIDGLKIPALPPISTGRVVVSNIYGGSMTFDNVEPVELSATVGHLEIEGIVLAAEVGP